MPELLRILEEFPGLIFLTTSRRAALDDCVKSRVHLNICFKALTLEQTLSIFKLHLVRLREEEQQFSNTQEHKPLAISEEEILQFAERQYNENAAESGRWNGRQVRDAVRMAVDLAHYDVIEKPSSQPKLRAEHFRSVEKMMQESEEALAKNGLQSMWGREDENGSLKSGDESENRRGDVEREAAGYDDESEVSLGSSLHDGEGGFQRLGRWSMISK